MGDASKGSETTTEPSAYRQQARWIGNNNIFLIFLAIVLLTVTLSCLCLVAVSFLYCFHQIPFFPVYCKIYNKNCNCVENIFVPSVHQPCVCTSYVKKSKKLQVLMINKDVCKPLACKKGNAILIWIWNNSILL